MVDRVVQARSPFHIPVGQGEIVVEAAQLREERFVEVFLPLLGALLAKEDAAAHRSDRVDRAEAIDLERARFLQSKLRKRYSFLIGRGAVTC